MLVSFGNHNTWKPNEGTLLRVARKLKARGIRFTNASIELHAYNLKYPKPNESGPLPETMKEFPLIPTETNLPKELNDTANNPDGSGCGGDLFEAQSMDRMKISWFHWKTNTPADVDRNRSGLLAPVARKKVTAGLNKLIISRCVWIVATCLLVGTALADEPVKGPQKQFNPLSHHQGLVKDVAPEFKFRDDTQFENWQPKLRESLTRVLAIPASERCPLDVEVTPQQSTDEFDSFRVVYQAEPGVRVPCYLLLPKQRRGPVPVMICLQGHKKKDGMLVSIGRVPDDGGRDIAIQAVRNGWAALAVEQRCFGERRGDCQRESFDALMLGRTLTGERVFDVMRAIDFIETRDDLDKTRVGCMGNSTGGTVTFYAACVDPRIRLAIVSCSYCTYAESWIKIQHCACGYLPGILKVADMGDLAGLVAPRNLIIVAGKEDYLATLKGVRTAFAQTKRIFTAAGCADNAELLVGDAGHQFYPELAWPRIQKASENWSIAE